MKDLRHRSWDLGKPKYLLTLGRPVNLAVRLQTTERDGRRSYGAGDENPAHPSPWRGCSWLVLVSRPFAVVCESPVAQ